MENNVNVDKCRSTITDFKNDPKKAKRINKLEGEWNLGQGSQFRATVQFEGGEMKLEADQPIGFGGSGARPSSVSYCLYGFANCYAATFATMASLEGVVLKKFRITAECDLDYSKYFGVTSNPIVEGVKFSLDVESDAPPEKLRKVQELANERCPAMFLLKNPVTVRTELPLPVVGGKKAKVA